MLLKHKNTSLVIEEINVFGQPGSYNSLIKSHSHIKGSYFKTLLSSPQQVELKAVVFLNMFEYMFLQSRELPILHWEELINWQLRDIVPIPSCIAIAVWPWASHYTSLSPCFLTCKVSLTVCPSPASHYCCAEETRFWLWRFFDK